MRFTSLSSPNPDLFDLALQTLEAIGDDPSAELPPRYFDLQLLHLSGFLPELYHCVECGEELEPERHRFAVGAGGALCLDCAPPDVIVRPLSLPALKVLRLLHRTEAVGQLPPLNLPAAAGEEVRGLLTAAIQYWLDRQVRSQAFLDAVKLA